MQLKFIYILFSLLSLLFSKETVYDTTDTLPEGSGTYAYFNVSTDSEEKDEKKDESDEEEDSDSEKDSKELEKQKKKEEKRKKKEEKKKAKEEKRKQKEAKKKAKEEKKKKSKEENSSDKSDASSQTDSSVTDEEMPSKSQNLSKEDNSITNSIDLSSSGNMENKLLQAIYDQNKKIDLLVQHLSPSESSAIDVSSKDDSMEMLELLQIVQNKFYDIDETITGSDSLFSSLSNELSSLGEKIETINIRLETKIQSLEMSQYILKDETSSRIDSLEMNFSSGGTSIKELEDLNKDLILKMLKIDDKYTSEIERLENKITELDNSISTLKKINKDLVVTALTQPQKEDPVSNDSDSSTANTNAPTTELTNDYKKNYNDAYSAYLDANYDRSLSMFEELLERDIVNDLTDNCQYWVGEIHYSTKNYSQAITAFNKVFSYQENNKAAYAQYKLGLCYLNINDTTKAVDAFTKVINQYNSQADLVKKSEQFISKYK